MKVSIAVTSLIRWLRYWLWHRPLAWLRREKVVVDSVSGRDDALGTDDAPLRTLAELNRRTHGKVLRGDLLIELHGDFDESLELSMSSRSGVVVTITGGTSCQQRDHMRAVKEFQKAFWAGTARARDFPEPPAGVASAQIKARKATVKGLRFGRRR